MELRCLLFRKKTTIKCNVLVIKQRQKPNGQNFLPEDKSFFNMNFLIEHN